MVQAVQQSSGSSLAAGAASTCSAAASGCAAAASAHRGDSLAVDEELGGDWVVVAENTAQVSSTPTTTSSPPSVSSTSPSASPAVSKKTKPRSPPSFSLPAAASTRASVATVPSLPPDKLLLLKKKVWQLRICERKSIVKTKELMAQEHNETLDGDIIESFTAEVERFRERLGMNWTWFQEELERGDHDARLLADPADIGGLDDLMLPAAMNDFGASPASGSGGSRRGAHATSRTSPKSTPKLQPKASPGSRREMPSREEQRKANFFSAACGWLPVSTSDIGSKLPCAAEALLFSVLKHAQVGEAVNLGLCSQAFAEALLLRREKPCGEAETAHGSLGSVQGLWSLLATRGFHGSSPGVACDSSSPKDELLTPFRGDPAFRKVTLARRRAFAADLARGAVQPATLVPPLQELSGAATELGPFVPAAAAHAGADRLLVGDGRQTFQVVDVSQQRVEAVTADHYGTKQTLQFSMGVHSSTVTASYSTSPSICCHLSGGILVGRDFSKGNMLPKSDGGAPLQWLQLPEFAAAVNTSAVSPPASGCASPQLGPSSSPASPALGPAAKPGAKPCTKASKSASVRSPAGPRSPALGPKAAPCGVAGPPALLRLSVSQEQLAAAQSSAAVEPVTAASLFVERVWSVSQQQAAVLVREYVSSSSSSSSSPTSGYAPPPRSPAASPLLSPSSSGMQVPPSFSLDDSDVGRQAASSSSSRRPRSFSCAGSAGGPAGRAWLQVWRLAQPSASSPATLGVPRCEARLEPLAASLMPSAVTAIDASACSSEGRHLLCGLSSGSADLRLIPSDGAAQPVPLASMWSYSGDAQHGPVLHTLLLRAGSVPGASPSAQLAILAQAGRVVSCPLDLAGNGAGSSFEVVLPLSQQEAAAELSAAELHVASLRPVGACGFAVCSDAHAFAFEVCCDRGTGLSAQVAAVVAFSSPAEVLYFEASLYDFFVVQDETQVACPEQNAFVGLWPPSGGLEAGQQTPQELRAWVRTGEARLSESKASALCLNSLLLRSKDIAPICALNLNSSAAVGGKTCRSDQLAVSALGPGVAVFWWGVEESSRLKRLRELHRAETAQAARQREVDKLHLQLQRCRQKLQDMDRLEARAQEKGKEALTEEELLKLGRREQVTQDRDRLMTELGLEGEGDEVSEEDDPDELLRMEQAQTAQRRREKEKQKMMHHESKRATQKDRAKKRDQKYTE